MKPTVCVDLDGVLADYSQGFQGIGRIGEPIPGAAEFTRRLSEFARVVIFTTRCKEYPRGQPLTETPSGSPSFDDRPAAELAGVVEAWLARHAFHFDEVYTGQGKPMAAAYVDDRAVVCRPQDLEHGYRPEHWFAAAVGGARRLCGDH